MQCLTAFIDSINMTHLWPGTVDVMFENTYIEQYKTVIILVVKMKIP